MRITRISPQKVREWEQLTHDNMHTEVLLSVAKYFGLETKGFPRDSRRPNTEKQPYVRLVQVTTRQVYASSDSIREWRSSQRFSFFMLITYYIMEQTLEVKTITKSEFVKSVATSINNAVREADDGCVWEPAKMVGANVLSYANVCESNFRHNLMDFTGRKTEWTWFSDISIAEWYGLNDVRDTITRAFKNWINTSYKAIAELLLALNYKAWEMAARKKYHWRTFYAELYTSLYNLVLDYYDQHDQNASAYVVQFLD